METKQNTTPTLPRAPVTPTLYTLPSPAALSAEAKAEGAGESVVLALCDVCGQPTAEWVVAKNAQVIQDLNNQLTEQLSRVRFLKKENGKLTADNAKLIKENQWLTEQLESNRYIASPDGGLPLWLPAAICTGFGVAGWLAANHIMTIIAALWGF